MTSIVALTSPEGIAVIDNKHSLDPIIYSAPNTPHQPKAGNQ